MLILGLDSATTVLGIGLIHGNRIIAGLSCPGQRRYLRNITPTLAHVFNSAGVTARDIDAYACVVGPGYFTGLRLGIAAVKALALPYGKPVAALCSLDVLASLDSAEDRCVAIHSCRGSFFYCNYHGQDRQDVPRLGTLPEIAAQIRSSVLLTPDFDKIYPHRQLFRPQLEIKSTTASGIAAAQLGARICEAGSDGDAFALRPMYLRCSLAEENKNGR